ncbi:MAG TPA: Zn-ribbon domain-containing OB-fold protein [Chloroflexi bacterium]|nr:Zn-ribbon domain-containing OB-fold protein [Chloroflexota bacterium]
MALIERVTRLDQTKAWLGEIPIQSRYTVGIAGERFFREIQEHGRFLGTRCPECDLIYVPPRLYCEACFAHLEEWVEVPTTGYVYTYTVVHQDLDGEPLPEPRLLAFIQLDGTDGGLVHFLGDVEPDQVRLGMRVEAVFKEKAERRGSILDIVHFRPVKG